MIRDYVYTDIPRILYIIKTAFAEQRGIVTPPSSAESKTIEIVKHELRTANALVFESDGEIIACVFYQPKGESIYVDRLAVLPEFRRRGVGRSLMEEVEKRAVELGAPKLSISVRIELVKQQNYYRRQGFEIVSKACHEGFSTPTYVIMVKRLTLL